MQFQPTQVELFVYFEELHNAKIPAHNSDFTSLRDVVRGLVSIKNTIPIPEWNI